MPNLFLEARIYRPPSDNLILLVWAKPLATPGQISLGLKYRSNNGLSLTRRVQIHTKKSALTLFDMTAIQDSYVVWTEIWEVLNLFDMTTIQDHMQRHWKALAVLNLFDMTTIQDNDHHGW